MTSTFLDRVSNKALGELLVEKGALSAAQVDEALQLSREKAIRLGEALVALGYLSRDALGYAIGEQYGLTPMELQPSMVDPDLVSRFDFDLLCAHTMLPLIQLGQELVVVVSDPNNQEGLRELARQLPDHTVTPQLATAGQIQRCLDAVRPLLNARRSSPVPRDSARNSDYSLPFFKSVPNPATPQFLEWLIGLSASHSDRDVLVRDLDDRMQVSLTPSTRHGQAVPDVGHEEIGQWPGMSAATIRDAMLQRARPVEHTREQAATWSYSISHSGKRLDFLILTPISHGAPLMFIRALTHSSNTEGSMNASPVPLALDLEAGKYTVLLYDESVDLESALSQFTREYSTEHSFVVAQYATRCVFPYALSYPSPFVNVVTAAQATAATCVIYDHPVEYREAVRLLTSTCPPPAVLVCAPMPSYAAGAGTLSPDVEELISRQGAQSVRLHDPAPLLESPITSEGDN